MYPHAELHPSHLFLVRLWSDPAGVESPAWQGKVQHLVSGEAHAFADWPTLVALLQTMLPTAGAPDPTGPAPTDSVRAGG